MRYKSITAIIAILIILVVALLKDVDGVLLAGGIAAIAGLGGYAVGKATKPKS